MTSSMATTSASPFQATKKCYLLALPLELRLTIYDVLFHSFDFSIDVGKETRFVRAEDIISVRPNEQRLTSAGLLRTCHKIYKEAFPVFYDNFVPNVRCVDPTSDSQQTRTDRPGRLVHATTYSATMKRARKATTSVLLLPGDTTSGLVSCVARVLHSLGTRQSLRELRLEFRIMNCFGPRKLDDELLLFQSFAQVKGSGKVKMRLDISQGRIDDNGCIAIRKEHGQLVERLHATNIEPEWVDHWVSDELSVQSGGWVGLGAIAWSEEDT